MHKTLENFQTFGLVGFERLEGFVEQGEDFFIHHFFFVFNVRVSAVLCDGDFNDFFDFDNFFYYLFYNFFYGFGAALDFEAVVHHLIVGFLGRGGNVVVAAQFDGQHGLGGQGREVAFVRVDVRHRQARNAELHRRLTELQVAVFFGVGIECDCRKFFALQDVFNQTGQHAFGTEFDENAPACRVDVFNLFFEMNRV